jgi:hypothetical protein
MPTKCTHKHVRVMYISSKLYYFMEIYKKGEVVWRIFKYQNIILLNVNLSCTTVFFCILLFCIIKIYTAKPLATVSEGLQKNDKCEKLIYIGNVQGPEKVNDTCVKTMHVGTINRGFTVYNISITYTHKTLFIPLK